MILKIVQIAVFSAPCFGVCAQFVRGAVREMRKKAPANTVLSIVNPIATAVTVTPSAGGTQATVSDFTIIKLA